MSDIPMVSKEELAKQWDDLWDEHLALVRARLAEDEIKSGSVEVDATGWAEAAFDEPRTIVFEGWGFMGCPDLTYRRGYSVAQA